MPDENLLLQCHPFTNKRMAADLAAIADFDPLLDFHKSSNLYVVAYLATVEIDESVSTHVPAQLNVRRDLLTVLVLHNPA